MAINVREEEHGLISRSREQVIINVRKEEHGLIFRP